MEKNYESRFLMPAKELRFSLTGLIILDKIIRKNRIFSAELEGDDIHIEEALDFLAAKNILDIDTENGCYKITAKGKKVYETFLARYKEYLKVYDVFCAVDLAEGTFAFEKLLDYNDEIFNNYVNSERFTDLRVTVLEFKNRIKNTVDPIEIVFISFLIEKRFREPKERSEVLGTDSWQYRVVYGDVFTEIVNICNNSPHYEELGYEDEDGVFVSGESVIQDVIEQGIRLMAEIDRERCEMEKSSRKAKSAYTDLDDLKISEETYTTHYDPYYYDPYYYNSYYDPYYVSPIWDLALLAIIL